MGKQRAKYGDKELDDAVQAVLAGAQLKATSKERNIAHSTLKKYVAAARKNAPLEANRRGPPPMLPKSSEDSIRDWILERQVSGHPVGRRDVIRKAQQIAELVCGVPVVEGWLRRFMERHPSLSLRKSQFITKARNEVEESDLSVLFSSLAKVVIENKMGAARVFNVDETAIETKREHKKVVVAKGSKNVWHRDIKTHFQLSFVACGSANGYVIPPLFIFPGESVSEDVFGTCQIPGAGVTTTEKAFMTGSLFARWLRFFSDAVPTPIQRPLLLLMDGCSSHISLDIVDTAKECGIILVCLPPNGTHLLQPLDVAVFSSFRNKLKVLIEGVLDVTSAGGIDQEKALSLAAIAWDQPHLETSMAAGFRSCGIFPLSRVNMHAKLDNFKHNGLPQSYRETAFVKISEVVQQKIIVLPAARQIKTGKRKRAKTSGRILTRESLKEETKVQKAKPGRRCKPTARKEHAAPVLQPSQAEWALHPREIWVQPRQELWVQHQHEAWV